MCTKHCSFAVSSLFITRETEKVVAPSCSSSHVSFCSVPSAVWFGHPKFPRAFLWLTVVVLALCLPASKSKIGFLLKLGGAQHRNLAMPALALAGRPWESKTACQFLSFPQRYAVPSDGPCSLCPAHVASSAAVQMDTVTPAPLQLQSAAAAHACAGDAAVMEKLLLAVTAAAEVTSVKITAMSLFIILSF